LNCKSGVSGFVSRRTVIAYWLIPAEPERGFFQDVINDLARRNDAPVFEPHVTIHVGANHADAAERALSRAARECQPIKLKALEIGHSREFIKTLFVQFAPSAKLRQLNRVICDAAQDSSHYELKPHLSLLYKKMSAVARVELARSIKVPLPEVIFDALQAVRCISPTRSRSDVEALCVLTTKKLYG
jgi:2'-5' RNA ligase